VPFRLAVVGCGEIARYVAFLARLNRRIRLVACCGRTQADAERFAARFRIPRACADYGAMLEREALDAVYLAVPHDLHFDMVGAAVKAGLPVLVEKPITRTLEDGQRIVRLAREAQAKVGVNYQYRYDAGCYALAMAARQGALGKLHYGRCNVPWHREPDYFEQGPWRGQLARAGGGTLITQGSHALDVLLWALGSPPRAAVGWTAQRTFTQVGVEDLALGVVELENGALAQITSSMIATPEQAVTVEVYGDEGTALYRSHPFPHVRFLGKRRGPRVPKARTPVWGLHALQRSLEAFRAWVVEGRPYLTPVEEALPVLAAISAIYRSARSGQREPVSLPR
jgi:UDP-N-acetyl-2-amino-2-deoxyglucuronate dehydrogenase